MLQYNVKAEHHAIQLTSLGKGQSYACLDVTCPCVSFKGEPCKMAELIWMPFKGQTPVG